MIWRGILFVFLGSGAGGVLRYLTAVGLQAAVPPGKVWTMPWSSLLVNIAGCFLFGLVFGLGMRGVVDKDWKLALTTGFCGGLTTFSTFGFETLTMISRGEFLSAAAYALVFWQPARGICLSGSTGLPGLSFLTSLHPGKPSDALAYFCLFQKKTLLLHKFLKHEKSRQGKDERSSLRRPHLQAIYHR